MNLTIDAKLIDALLRQPTHGDTASQEQHARDLIHTLMLERDGFRDQALQLAEELSHLRKGRKVVSPIPLLFPRDHVHFDIETLGTGPTSVILSIGAVRIDFERGVITDEFYTNVDPDDCEFMGLTTDESTIRWWKQQNERVRARTFDKSLQQPLRKALLSFSRFVESGSSGVEVSCCGTDFDTVIVSNAYRVIGVPVPWKFWNVIDMRTLRNWVPNSFGEPRPENAHDALADARWQGRHLMRIWDTLAGVSREDDEL